MRIEDKRMNVSFLAMTKGDVFQFADISEFSEFENKYFLLAEDNELVDIETGEIYSFHILCEKHHIVRYDEVNVTLLNAKLVIE